jgi:predicted transcriptional regulator
MIKLTREQTEQAVQHPEGVSCQGDGVDQTFVIVDADVMRQMQEALTRSDIAAIQAGINDMEAGRMQPAEEAHRQGRQELTSRYQR